MGRPQRIDDEETIVPLQPVSTTCPACGNTARVAYHTQRHVTPGIGHFCLALTVRRCQQESCPHYHQPYRPEEEGRWALPYGEYGLDVIALVGMLRYRQHHSLAELHQALRDRGLSIGERTVLNLLARYEELVSIPAGSIRSAPLQPRQADQRLHRTGAGKKRFPPSLKQLHHLLLKGLRATAALWPPLESAYCFAGPGLKRSWPMCPRKLGNRFKNDT